MICIEIGLIRMQKAELVKFKYYWDLEVADGEELAYMEEMKRHAQNAIAWNMKARSLGHGH